MLIALWIYSTCAGQLEGKPRLPLQYGHELVTSEEPPVPHAAPYPLPERNAPQMKTPKIEMTVA
jgi:hypothetical protein